MGQYAQLKDRVVYYQQQNSVEITVDQNIKIIGNWLMQATQSEGSTCG